MTPRLTVPVLCLALLVAGCRDPASDEPVNGVTDAAAEAPSDAGEEVAGASREPSVDGDDGTDAEGLFCVSAEAGAQAVRALLDATDLKSAETGKEDDSGDVGVMNSQGAIMVASIAEATGHWREAQSALDSGSWDDAGADVSTAAVDAAVTDYLAYLDGFALAEAELAASAGSIAEYDAGMVAVLTDADSLETAVAGAAALGDILLYAQDRCGVLAAFS